MIASQLLTKFRPIRVGIAAGLFVAVLAAPGLARDLAVFSGGAAVPVGDAASFADPGGAFRIAWRHYNRGRTAWELTFGYNQNKLQGAVQDTISSFETLVRAKNLLAQQQGGPGMGFILAEFGTLEIYSFNLNILYRVSQRSRFSPVLSVGAGVYNWRVPFKIQFFDVPSFGEQHAYDPIGSSRVYAFIFDERWPHQQIDYTKHQWSGGLNAAIALDLRLSRSFTIEAEGRTHLIFSSGTGNQEENIDDQKYLDNMTLVYLQAGLSYRF